MNAVAVRRAFFLTHLFFLAPALAVACTGAMPGGGDAAGPMGACTTDMDCDDGLACNGTERCASVSGVAACEAAPVPLCLSGQTCDEVHDSCQTNCAVARDADGDGVDAIECGGTDCDDSDRHRFPGNVEVCDVDAHDEDCDPTTFGVRDADGDGEPDARCCNVDASAHRICGTDCDDSSANVHPGQAETCNMRDDDCDTAVDEMAQLSFYPDADHDGFGAATGMVVMACTAPPGTAPNMGDCDDMQAASNPSAPEVCDGIDNNCNGTIDEGLAMTLYPDVDRDGFGDMHATGMLRCPAEGFVASSSDCDDTTPSARPGLIEVCDGIDNNCNGTVDEGLLVMLYPDADGDGDGDRTSAGSLRCPASGFSTTHTDCDDTSRVTYGGAPEICDAADNDCDAIVDESTLTVPWYPDGDMDGYGNPRLPPILSCTPIAGRSQLTECDDNRNDVHPGAPQLCDGVDNTCATDDGSGHAPARPSEDVDGDMHAAPAASCMGGYPRDDCDDSMAVVHPGAAELCDLLDYDCSSGGGVARDEDADADGHAGSTYACSGGSLPHDDCNDMRAATHPGATETCDRIDDDCSSGGGVLAAEDADSDLFSPASAACSGGYPMTDCDDTRATTYPGAPETCDLLDDNCSGVVDEGCPASFTVGPTIETRHLHDPFCGPVTTVSGLCAAGQVVTGVDLYQRSATDVRLDGVAAYCAAIGLGTSGATGAPQVYTVNVGAGSVSGARIGITSSTHITVRCPAGTVATRVRLGGHQLVCQPLIVSGSIGAFTITPGTPSTTVGSSANITIDDLDPGACTSGYVVNGFTGAYCASVRPSVATLDAQCAQLAVTLR